MSITPKILISGGGTGGHVFPAIAIADAIKGCFPSAQFLFIGAFGKIEMEKVPMAGYHIRGLWISGLDRRNILKNLLFPIKLLWSLIASFFIVFRFRPNLAIGVGGYASGPSIAVAHWLGVPYFLQEQNAFPGITNKILKKSAQKICVAYPGMEKYFPSDKIVFTGNPIRKSFLKGLEPKSQAIQFFEIPENLRVILIVGGSLGAASINRTIYSGLSHIIENPQIFWIWQTGPLYFEKYNAAIKVMPNNLFLTPFLDRMDMAYAAADLVIGRAGALTISELIHIAKPAILVPSPNVAEDHQTRNAESFQMLGGGIFIKDDEIEEKLILKAIEMVSNSELLEDYKTSLQKNHVSDAAQSIAELSIPFLKSANYE